MSVIGDAYLNVKPTPGSEQAFTQSVRSTALKAAALAAGIFAVRKLFQIGKESLASFYEAEKITALLDDRVQALGASAGVTTEGVEALADNLLQTAGIEDEVTKSAATLLLTFTEIRNQMGEGNDIFDRSISALTDMSIVMGTDARGAALQLGKALNDPITGMAALRRSGVSFNAEQKELITNLTESGNLLDAQKIILRELEKEFGGAAAALGETAAGKSAILTANIGEMKEAFGSFLSDALNPTISALTTYVRLINSAIESRDAMDANAQASRDQMDALGRSYIEGRINLGELRSGLDDVTTGLDDQTLKLGDASILRARANTLIALAEESEVALAAAVYRGTEATEDSVSAKKELIETNKLAAQTTRDLLTAELEAAGGLLGAISATREARTSRRELAVATKRLADIEADGRKGSDAWKEARKEVNDLVFESVEAQAKLEESYVSYGQSLADAGIEESAAIAKVKELARQGGVQKGALQGIIDKVKEYADKLEVIPEEVPVKFKMSGLTDSIAAIDRLIAKQNELDRNGGGGSGGGGNRGGGGDGPVTGIGPFSSTPTIVNVGGRVVEEATGRHSRKVGGRSVP